MTIGIVGAGQLGRMLALAGYPLGFDFLFLDRSAATPAGQLAPILCGDMASPKLLARLARRSAVVTFDWENASVAGLKPIARLTRVFPPIEALAAAQDRLREKRLFEALGIPTTRFAAVASRKQLLAAIAQVGLPGVLKTRHGGYDGKGQFVIRGPRDIDRAWDALGALPCLYENLVPFDYEVSAIGVRGSDGATAFYPLNRNLHRGGILRLTRAPFGSTPLTRRANAALRRILDHFGYVGVLTIEFFVHRGRLIANEIAPRVHNSGHWTIEGAVTSQFENHIRAITGLPLGSTQARGHSAMINLIGTLPPRADLLARPGVHLHDYRKDPRPDRKLGHITLIADSAARRDSGARALLRRIDRETWVSFR